MFSFLLFLVCALAVFYSGMNLAKYGDVLGEKLNIGKTWVGIALIASITSLPELITGISAVTFVSSPNIAVGDIYGSCLFNLVILASMDILFREEPISKRVQHGAVLTAAFSIILTTLSLLALVHERELVILHVSAYSFLILLVYLLTVKLVFSYERRALRRLAKGAVAEGRYVGISLREALYGYFGNSLIILVGASFLPYFARDIADDLGVSHTAAGAFLVAVSTSLPEIFVSYSAVKLGVVDIAVANILGSNLFNLAILAVDDLFFLEGSLYRSASPENITLALFLISMTSVFIVGSVYKADRKHFLLAWDSGTILLLYLLSLLFVVSR